MEAQFASAARSEEARINGQSELFGGGRPEPLPLPAVEPWLPAERLTREYMEDKGVDWRFIRTYGATEVFPPEDADLIVDNTATNMDVRNIKFGFEFLGTEAGFGIIQSLIDYSESSSYG